jgi:hypothetical protein
LKTLYILVLTILRVGFMIFEVMEMVQNVNKNLKLV